MPQLAVETYFSQFFWLFVILFIFNDFILHKYIPGIAKILKARKETSSYTSKDIIPSTINIELPVFNIQTSNKINKFNNTRLDWINKQK
jgi:hypothetical protein